MITRGEILTNRGMWFKRASPYRGREVDRIFFSMPVPFGKLAGNEEGIDMLNEMVDDFVEDGYLLEDIDYALSRIEGENIIVVVNADATEWLKGV